MKTLVVEDDFTSRLLLQEVLKVYGPVHVAVNGKEAISAVRAAMAVRQPYNLVCMDIMMPEMDGQNALKAIRDIEEGQGITSTYGAKVFMTTALGHPKDICQAFYSLCDSYLVKPIDRSKLISALRQHKLIS